MSEGVQVFCDICSRGVLIHKESIYKCKKCGKQVCVDCFDRGFIICKECAKPIRLKQNCRDCIYYPGHMMLLRPRSIKDYYCTHPKMSRMVVRPNSTSFLHKEKACEYFEKRD